MDKKGSQLLKFPQEKDKAQKKVHTSHKVGDKRDHFKSLHHLVNHTNGENSRCHHTRFTVNSSHKALSPISNETPHFR
ncbi:hypothetical protein H5410_031136 [Solanum commersonii]|uniref:Uncharacterized protein n=1 Tax=Solanum commersonii TaxID=4109 RepID=A0A9J5YLE9_SOLCO|nr:hypothetical protein H5410_031136 [Solanum commersonii]